MEITNLAAFALAIAVLCPSAVRAESLGDTTPNRLWDAAVRKAANTAEKIAETLESRRKSGSSAREVRVFPELSVQVGRLEATGDVGPCRVLVTGLDLVAWSGRLFCEGDKGGGRGLEGRMGRFLDADTGSDSYSIMVSRTRAGFVKVMVVRRASKGADTEAFLREVKDFPELHVAPDDQPGEIGSCSVRVTGIDDKAWSALLSCSGEGGGEWPLRGWLHGFDTVEAGRGVSYSVSVVPGRFGFAGARVVKKIIVPGSWK